MKKRCFQILFCILLFPVISKAQNAIEFIENKGQWPMWYQYMANTTGGNVYLGKNAFHYVLADKDNAQKIDAYHHGQITVKPTLKFHVYKVSFEGANSDPVITGEKPQRNYYNYFIGNNPAKWKSDIHPDLNVNYDKLYNGIDMHVTSEKGYMMYDFFIHPDGDANQIRLKFDGLDALQLKDDNLVISTSVGQVMEMKPYAYQYINNERVEVPCKYRLENNTVTYHFPKGYNHSQMLVIDPTIVFCSFTGSTADNWGFTATYDNDGNFYLGGLVNAVSLADGGGGGSYPVSPGAYQSIWGGGTGSDAISYASDVAIMKLNAAGTDRIYATYLGGSGNERPHSLIVDANGNLVIAGRTHSTDFPVVSGCYSTTNSGGWDIFVTKLNTDGTGLVGSTYMGGAEDDGVNEDSTEIHYGQLKLNYGDDARSEVQVDRAGNVYVAGCTNSLHFPTTAAAISTTLQGKQDGVVFKLDSNLKTLIWSTYIGGSGSDAGYVLAFDSSQQSLYVAGGTNSPNFPATSGTLNPTYLGDSADGFVLKFQNSGSYPLLKGTFIGTSNYDQVYGIQVDNDDNVYVMGQSIGGLFPVTPGVYSNPHSTQFIMKMDNNLSTDLISTVYGSGDPLHTNISPVAFLVDTCNNVYISGWGGNLFDPPFASPLTGTCDSMPVTPDAKQATTDGRDFYFIVLGSGLTTLRYATYYGRTSAVHGYGEHVDGGTSRFDKHGVIYQGICANCGGPGSPPFPTTSGSWATLDGSFNCNEAGLKIAFNLGPVTASINAHPVGSGCAPLTVDFTNASDNAITWVWNFGDGSATDTSYAPVHTFTAPGTYTVSLSATNANACFRVLDTATYVVVVDSNAIKAAFEDLVTDSCGPFSVIFTNTSTYSHTPGSTSFTVFNWDFGDGTSFTGANPSAHNYPDTGYYTITLTMTDTTACITKSVTSHVVHFGNERVTANFYAPDTVCAGTAFNISDSSYNAVTHTWFFGNGGTSSSETVSYKYDTAGIYTIVLIAGNPAACKSSDTFTHVIVVQPVPTALFNYDPVIPKPNDTIRFTNNSINATRYEWSFGDMTTTTDVNPVHFFLRSGTFSVCLEAFNASSCPSKLCRQVTSDIEPHADIPTGFSPNGDGANDMLYVRGVDIASLDLKIYNRWGEMVFETTDQNRGWDGTYNGKPQPMEAYAYVLKVLFIDGTSKEKKGNVTLLR